MESALRSVSRPAATRSSAAEGVVHLHDLLGDDRALVELRVDVVGGGADGLHAAGVRLVVGLGALEAGQEGVVDVDGAAVQLGGSGRR